MATLTKERGEVVASLMATQERDGNVGKNVQNPKEHYKLLKERCEKQQTNVFNLIISIKNL
jgi:hypothetical protein